MTPLLAQALNSNQERTIIIWGGLMILLAVGGFAGIMYFKRYLRKRSEQSQYDTGFSLSDLKQMLYRGEITPEEYETTRAHIIAKVKGKMLEPRAKPKRQSEPSGGDGSGGASWLDGPSPDSSGSSDGGGDSGGGGGGDGGGGGND